MRRLSTILAAATLTAAGLALAPTTQAAAAPAPAPQVDLELGMQVLDTLCEWHGGTAYFSPFAISRCERAKARRGTALEQLICEGLLGGDFVAVQSPGRRNRVNWQCFPGPIG